MKTVCNIPVYCNNVTIVCNLPVHCNNVITICNLPSSPFGATGCSPVILVVLLVKLTPLAANKNNSLKDLAIKAEIPFDKRDNSHSVELN